jgi:hypothetical protein
MSKIYKTARIFQQKLVLASNANLQNLKSVYQSADKVGKTLKSLWMAADKDPYSDFNPEVGKAADKISRIGRNAYYQATTKGMPAEGQFGYSSFLSNMNGAVQELENLGPFTNLDPSASNALGELKQTLSKAQSEFMPIGIPAPVKPVIMPEDKITGNRPNIPSGVAYTPEGEEDYTNQVSRPGKNWSGEFPTQ